MSLLTGNESKIFAKGVIGNVRTAQEDSHSYRLATPNGDLFVVCDGMGGHVGGAMASSLAVDSIIGYLSQELYPDPQNALDGALQFANMQILGYAAAHPEYRGMGTTACIVLMRGDDVWIAHVGDSRIYLYLGAEQQLHRLTKDHSLVQKMVDQGQISDDEAELHPLKNRILQALGVKDDMQPTLNPDDKPIHVKNGDIFLICSDGLSGMIPDRTIERVMREPMTLQQRGEQLIELAMQGETVQPGGQDNCTVELIEVDNSPWTKSDFYSFNPIQQQITETDPEPSTPSEPMQITDAPAPSQHHHRWTPRLIATLSVAVLVLTVALWGFIYSQRPSRQIARLEKKVCEKKAWMEGKKSEMDKSRQDMQNDMSLGKSTTNDTAYTKMIKASCKKFEKDSTVWVKAHDDYVKDSLKLEKLKKPVNKSTETKTKTDTVSKKKKRIHGANTSNNDRTRNGK